MKKSISGIRGIFGDDLILPDVLRFCRNFAMTIPVKKCVIGNDTRPSNHLMVGAAIAGLLESGINVYNLGTAPTPVVFRESRKYGAGLVITSSHNPLNWNGIKFIINGRGPNEREFSHILREKIQKRIKFGKEYKITSNYVRDAVRIIGKINHSPKIILDIGGGAASSTAPELLKKLGCQIHVINEKSFKRGPDPTTDNLIQLVSASRKYDIGFAFDLDGDRLVVVRNGKKLSPDTTLALGVSKALELGYKKFCLSIDTSISVEKYIKEHGGQVIRSKVGEANVIETMIKQNCQAGGEGSSGGFILPKFNMCRDGILTSGLIASMTGKKIIDEVIELVSKYYQLRTKINVESVLHDKILLSLKKKLEQKYGKIIDMDGIKIIVDEDTWALVRKSNTEDILRISIESNSLQKAQQIQKEITILTKQSYEQAK